MSLMYDEKIKCYSLMTSIKLAEYLSVIENIHANKGAITGQRDVLKTATARRIRTRMISDILSGAVLPPVVLGVVEKENSEFKNADEENKKKLLLKKDLSIIDGMQRTEAYIEAVKSDEKIGQRDIRVEFWVAESTNSLIYRMLILNTGQVPWTLARQLGVVYAPLVKEIELNVKNIKRIFTPDAQGRRVKSGEYSADDLVEVYLAFSLRKAHVETKESLAEEFSKLDLIENLSNKSFNEYFYTSLGILVNFDLAIEKYELTVEENSESETKVRFSRGIDLFSSQPARVGLMAALGVTIIGRPGIERDTSEQTFRLEQIKKSSAAFIEYIQTMNVQDLEDFLRFDVLREVINRKNSQVGRFERDFFYDAFRTLIEVDFKLPNLETCWRAN